MNEKKIEQQTKELEKHLESLIKVKFMRILTEALKSKKHVTRWQTLFSLIESLQPDLLDQIEKSLRKELRERRGES